jgi:hypothetical protein
VGDLKRKIDRVLKEEAADKLKTAEDHEADVNAMKDENKL